MPIEEKAVDTQAAETNDQAAEQQAPAKAERKGPTKRELKRQLDAYEAKPVITNADAKAIHSLRRQIEETR